MAHLFIVRSSGMSPSDSALMPPRGGRNLNTAISYAFRTAVAVHFACLFVLFFVLRWSLVAVRIVPAVLSILMAVVGVLFVADMATRKDEGRGQSKLVDAIIGCVWFVVVAFLLMNSCRTGIW